MRIIPVHLPAIAAPLALLTFSSCSSHQPTTPPVTTQVSPGYIADDSSFGGEVVVNSTTGTATVVSINSTRRQLVLKRPDGRLAHCRARPGVVTFDGIKAGDEVTIGVAEQLELFPGKGGVPGSATRDPNQIHVRVPAGVNALAEAVEILTYTAKVAAIDDWNDAVTLQLANGQTKTVRVSEAVNLADFKPGDDVSARITEATALLVQNQPSK